MQAACPPLWSAHQVIFFFFFRFKKSKTSPLQIHSQDEPFYTVASSSVSPSSSLIESHPFSFTPKMTKLLSGGKSQQVPSQMQFFLHLQRKMKFALESKSIRSYHSNF